MLIQKTPFEKIYLIFLERLFRCILVLYFGLSPLLAKSQPPPLLLSNQMDSVIDLRPHAYILADTFRTYTWKSAAKAMKEGKFAPLTEFEWASKFTRGKYAYWLAIDIRTEAFESPQQLIFNPTKKDSLHVWQLLGGQQTTEEQVGGHILDPAIQQRLPFPVKADVPLVFEPDQHYRLLVRMVSELAFHTYLQPKLHAPDHRSRTLAGELPGFLATYGVFFGILFFMAIFSIVQFFQNRDWAFMWYAFYLLALLLFYLRELSGWNQVFSIFPSWFYHHFYYIPVAFGLYFFYLFFINSFLNSQKEMPELYEFSRRLALGMIAFVIVERVLVGIDPWWSWRFITYMRIAFVFIGIYGLFLLLKHRNRLVFYVLAGTAALLVSNLITILISFKSDHSIGFWDYTHIPSYVGVLVEILFFSTGLGYKTNLLEVAKMQAEEEAKRLSEVSNLKSNLYTNITHEFRTPLTVILGLADEVEKNPAKNLKERIGLIRKNGRHLLYLIGEVLDLAKLDKKALELHLVRDDIISFLRMLTESHHSYALSKKIGLQFFTEVIDLEMDFDPNRLRHVVSNLLSNAFKFTPEYGKVLVFAKHYQSDGKEWLEIRVKDTGLGIARTELTKIFERFYQADTHLSRKGEGTGIGLALVMELVGLMKGEVWAESEPGRGSEFFVKLLVRREAMPVAMGMDQYRPIESNRKTAQPVVIPYGSQNERPRVLVIEDNADVVYYLRECLQENWQVLIANNGLDGVEMAIEHIPDIIISDVMMPGLDGFEVCKKLKSDERTSHIPMLLLTAKATQQDKLTGFDHGADAYLMKPFDKQELLLRLDNFIKLQENLRTHLRIAPPKDVPLSPEQLFMKKVNDAIEKRLDDHDYSIHQFTKDIGMSRAQLYRKLKALTGKSIARYLRNYRLQRAKQLLETTDQTVSEIAYQVGFNNLSWFAQAFRELFGESPSETRK